MSNTNTKRKDENKEELNIILDYDVDLYSIAFEEQITAKCSDKVPGVKDEYEEELELIESYMSRRK